MSRRQGGTKGLLDWDSLPDPGPRFQLGERLGSGVTADVYEAQDLQEGNRPVAIKIQRITDENVEDLEEEYRVLKQYSEHQNLPDFYGTYRKKGRDGDQLWFVMQLCQEGSVIEFVRALHKANRKLSELHIAFILKEVIKAVLHLHQNHVMHRDIRGSNILITKSGEVKLVDFGLSRELNSTMGKRGTSVGSPSWMAPEVVTSEQKGHDGHDAYDNRIDVWSLGITAIELADGKAPFEDMHPTRALFQIVRNPPPTLYRPSNWTQIFNDFIAECLEKNPDNRPFMMEMIEHPFFENLPENDSHISQELKLLVDNVRKHKTQGLPEVLVRTNFMKKDQISEPEPMFLEDLASMDHVSEDMILEQLQQRLKRGSAYTFVGDVLLFINPNEKQPIYSEEMHAKYFCKSRSDNVPHIYSVADCAYQDVLHHEEAQHIILSGESLSGKTANMMHILNHLLYLGKGNVATAVRIVNGMTLIHAIGNACTPLNANSTRHVLHTQVTFTTTGKVSGAIFWLYQLERWRITSDDRRQGNFHLFYYFYDAMTNNKQLDKYHLDTGRRYRYLRSVTAPSGQAANGVSSDPASASENTRKFEEFRQALMDLEFGEENFETLKNVLSAIIILGEVRFRDSGDGKAEIENPRVANSVAQLLQVEEKKFSWAMVNYCIIEKGQAQKRHQSPEEAEEARDALARAMYSRLVDWLVNFTNMKLSFSRAVFGDRHMVSILDLFGFECFQKNTLEQLMVNSLNEQLQYHYTQRLFAWEMQEREEEDISSAERLTFYNNRPTVDLLMAKPDGVMWLVDEATRTSQGAEFITEKLKKGKSPFCQFQADEFSVAHYTGKVSYDAKDLPKKNHDFVPPEITETMRLSTNAAIQDLFTHQLSRTGNLTQPPMDVKTVEKEAPEDKGKDGKPRRRSKWGALLVADKQQKSNRSYNTLSRGQFSQTRRMRTATSTFRAVCLELLRALNIGGTHFVRCLRAELTGQPRGFQLEVVRQQVRALGIVDTVRARQNGFPFRVPFSEFLRRYKFLAFDFDENVEETADNCRLLMVRLKMEGYAMGKSKVFLKYYNEEYLARLYEQQVKKIVKVQAMMRAFLAKKRVDGAGSKAPGSLAGMSEKPIDAGNDDAFDESETVDAQVYTRYRNPLASVLDYLEDEVEEAETPAE